MKRPSWALPVVIAAMLLSACGSPAPASPATPTPPPAAAKPSGTSAPASLSTVPKPSGNLSFKVGWPDTDKSFYSVPLAMTDDRLNGQGWQIEEVLFTDPGLNAVALGSNQIQIAISFMLDPLRVIAKGGNVAFLMENNPSEFVLVAPTAINKCEDLSGHTLGVQTEAAPGTVALKQWTSKCGATPNFLVLTGGENRTVALINNKLDTSLSQLANYIDLDTKAPGRFHLMDIGNAFAPLSVGIWANGDWLAQNQPVATAFIAELLNTYRLVRSNDQALFDGATKYSKALDPNGLPRTIKAFYDLGAWPPNGGDQTIVPDAITFFSGAGEVPTSMTADKVVNSQILPAALTIVGKAN